MGSTGRGGVEVVILGPAEPWLARALWSVGLRPVRGGTGPIRWVRPQLHPGRPATLPEDGQ
jgi:hypothetical protein